MGGGVFLVGSNPKTVRFHWFVGVYLHISDRNDRQRDAKVQCHKFICARSIEENVCEESQLTTETLKLEIKQRFIGTLQYNMIYSHIYIATVKIANV